MSRPIPAEITDHIIGLVEVKWSRDTKTLCNCSLVCRAWLPRSRTRLFDQIYFSHTPNYNKFNTAILRNASMQPWLAHVHKISFWAPGPSNFIPSPADPHEEKWSQRFMHEIAGRLPNLKAMYLQGFDWVHLPPHPTICATFSTFRDLRALTLRHWCLHSFSVFHGILVALPSLKELELWDVKCPPAPREVIFTSRREYPTLTALTILFPSEESKHCINNLLRWLGTTPTTQTIRNICFRTYGNKSWIDSQVDFMCNTSHSVTNLSYPHLKTGKLLHQSYYMCADELSVCRFFPDTRRPTSKFRDPRPRVLERGYLGRPRLCVAAASRSTPP